MKKKLLAAAAAAVLMFGTVTALPNEFDLLGADIPVAAATSGDYEYNVLDDGTAEITGYNGTAATITIPSKLGGKKVTKIGTYAFSMSKAKNVTIPDSVTAIDERAFYNCAVEKVTIPDSVTSMGKYAFCACSISSVKLPSKLKTISEGAFASCSNLTSVTIPDSVTSISASAFANCESLKSITLPDSIKSIGDYAFCNSSLNSITIPEGVTSIGEEAFFTKTIKSVIIPSSVIEIGERAFGYWRASDYDETQKLSGFTITGSNSVAEKYAKDNGIKYIDTRLSKGSVTISYSSYTYRGRAIKPTVTVKNNAGTKLKKDTDYTVSYSGNTNAGTATITVKGKGSYTGSLKKTFTVKALDLTSSYAKIEIPYSAYTYTGSAIKPAVTVKFKDGDVIPADQYTVSYSNNTKVGTATITVKGKTSNVTGTYKKTFVVKPAKNEITSISTTSGAFKIKWKKGTAGTVGYQVLYSQDKAALNAASGEVKNSSAKKYVHSYTSTNLSDLSESFSTYPKSGETWYVKVRSFYTKDGKTTSTRYGNYSAVKSIKVK